MSSRVPAQTVDTEAARQAALDTYAIVDSGPERAFDDIVTLAVTLCGVSAASISLIDHDRVWFKAQIGVDQEHIALVRFAQREAKIGRGQGLALAGHSAGNHHDFHPFGGLQMVQRGGQPPVLFARGGLHVFVGDNLLRQ